MFKNKKMESGGLDNFLRLFPKVMKNKELTLLQKVIISDVVSRQIQGQQYFKTSGVLAEELGTYKKKTIQMNFQYLESLGYLNTRPYNDGKHTNDLREAEVVQIEKWIFQDDFLEKSKIQILPIAKKNKDGDYAWSRKRKQDKLVLVDNRELEVSEEDEIKSKFEFVEDSFSGFNEESLIQADSNDTEEASLLSYPVIDWDDLDNSESVGKSLIAMFKEKMDFPFETINVDDGKGNLFEDEAMKIPKSSKYYLKSTLMMIDETLFPEIN